MVIYTIVFLSIILFSKVSGVVDKVDGGLTVPELLTKYNYPNEVHQLITEDGYILTIHRIPNKAPNAKVVLMGHGIIGTSCDFVILGPEKALAYSLFEQGYDVWLLNVRGNPYSMHHVSLDPSSSEYWNFSFEEMGLIDVPQTIDYILNVTQQTQLDYVGYSQGTTIGFVLLAMKPDYNAKVKNFVAIAPVAFLNAVTSSFQIILGNLLKLAGQVLNFVGHSQFSISKSFVDSSVDFCSGVEFLCKNIFSLAFGYGSDNIEPGMYEVIAGQYPTSCSTKQLIHFSQFIETDYFRRYDYGNLLNYYYYGSDVPENYTLSEITTKVYLHYSESDTFSTKEDVQYLASLLRNHELIFHTGFNHMDVLYAKTAPEIYKMILSNLSEE